LFQRRETMDPSAAKLIGAGLASIALVGAGVGIKYCSKGERPWIHQQQN